MGNNNQRGHVLVAFGDWVTEGCLALGVKADEYNTVVVLDPYC